MTGLTNPPNVSQNFIGAKTNHNDEDINGSKSESSILCSSIITFDYQLIVLML